MNSINIRAFQPNDWMIFKEFRLRALKAAPGVFATSYQEAVTRSPEEWQTTICGPVHQVFGLFDDERLIGITAVFTSRDDPSGETAELAMSFILAEYRGQGLSRLLYETRLNWIRAQPQFRRVIVSHRGSNEASRRANQHYGFLPIGRTARKWPDGESEDEVFYELLIPKR